MNHKIEIEAVPKVVVEKLVRVQRRFLWGGGLDQNKIAWVSWKSICLPKEEGGLGIKDINQFNLALLGKWLWNLMQNKGELWARVLESKYGGWRGLFEVDRVGAESVWWGDLKRALIQSQQGQILQKGMKWKQQLIQQMGSHKDSGWEWNFTWRRPLFDSEIDRAVNFLTEVQHKEWLGDPTGQYSAHTAYSMLGEGLEAGTLDECYSKLWSIKVPSKVIVFAWRLLRDRLPTRLNLQRRQVQLTDISCPFCIIKEEDAAHLFLHCSKIQPLWWETMSWPNLKGAIPLTPKQHFQQFIDIQVDGARLKRWQCWWMALMWSIWKLRNSIVFSNAAFNANKLFEDATFILWT
ncbi:putative ribonuclease H protein [Glycine max]|nr:putative ribonuclease H protein [Glycine max]